MTSNELVLVASINAAWTKYEQDIQSVYATTLNAEGTRNTAIEAAITAFEALGTTQAVPISEPINTLGVQTTTPLVEVVP
jgi:hypothetical protein